MCETSPEQITNDSFAGGNSLKSANNLLRYESTRSWLSKHKVAKNEVAIEKFEKIKRNESIKQWMLEGLATESNGKEALATNMLFTCQAPTHVGRGQLNSAFSDDKFEDLLKVVSEFDRHKVGTKDRLLAGMNPSTLMTEYRRKVTIQALLDTGDTKEDRKIAIEKLQSLLVIKENEKEREQLSKSIDSNLNSLKSAGENILSKSHSRRNKNKNSTLSNSNYNTHSSMKSSRSTSEFKAKWEHFDVMKDRWRYLLPQTRELLEPSSFIAPTSSSMAATSAFLVEGDLVTGTYREVAAFKNRLHTNTTGSAIGALH